MLLILFVGNWGRGGRYTPTIAALSPSMVMELSIYGGFIVGACSSSLGLGMSVYYYYYSPLGLIFFFSFFFFFGRGGGTLVGWNGYPLLVMSVGRRAVLNITRCSGWEI